MPRPMRGRNTENAKASSLRPSAEGLQAVGMPESVTTLPPGDKYAGTDLRGSRRYIFTLRDGQLLLLGYRDEGQQKSTFVTVEQILFSVEGGIRAIVPVGQFLVVSTNDGQELLLFSDGVYTLLGKHPSFPDIVFGTTERTTINAEMPACKLRGNYPTWSGSLQAEDVSTLSRAALRSLSAAQATATAQGMRINPTIIRTALRLHDGSLLWSESASIVGDRSAALSTLADATEDEAGTYRTDVASFSLTAWKLSATLVQANLGTWKRLIKAVEIYATEEIPVCGDTVRFRCETSQTGEKRHYLRATADTALTKALLSSLPTQTKLHQVAVVTDLEAMESGKMQGRGIRPATDGSGGELHSRTFAIEFMHRPSAAEYAPKAHPFAAGEITPIGTRLIAGNISHRLPYPMQAASLWNPSGLTTGRASVNIAVRIPTGNKVATVASTTATSTFSTKLNGLLCYPDRRATTATITVLTNGKYYRCEQQLSPAPTGNFAYATDLDGFELQPVEKGTFTGSSEIWQNDEGAVMACLDNNPLLWENCEKARCRGVTALCPSFAYGNSWQLGRHPCYLFATDGIYLLSFDKYGTCTDASLISSRHLYPGIAPAVTTDSVTFADSQGRICRLTNAKVKPTDIYVSDITGIAYCRAFDELWVTQKTAATIVTADNSSYIRPMPGLIVHASPFGSLLSDGNQLYDTDRETAGTTAVELVTQPIPIPRGSTVSNIVWDIVADNTDLQLSVFGENGRSYHGEMLSRLHVAGNLRAPLFHKIVAPQRRTVRLSVAGTLPTGTEIRTFMLELTDGGSARRLR